MTVELKTLPRYTRKEEILNSLTHLIGFVFGLSTFVFFIIFKIQNDLSFSYMLPFFIYSLCMLVVFFVSTFYHSSPLRSRKRAIARIIDHCDIYLFVAATYFPICVHGIENKTVAIVIMVIEVILAIMGILFNAIPNQSKLLKILSYLIYLIDGWLLVFFFPFNIGISFNVFIFILIGGIVYSIGAITYALGKKKMWFHSLFHTFVVFAAVLQFIGIYFLL